MTINEPLNNTPDTNVSLFETNPSAILHIEESCEVARIFPVYQCLSKDKKKYVLNNLIDWCRKEMSLLETINIL